MRNVITTGDVPHVGVLEVLRGTIVTPSARELARDRGVPIVEVAPEEYARAVKGLKGGDRVLLRVRNQSSAQFITLRLPK